LLREERGANLATALQHLHDQSQPATLLNLSLMPQLSMHPVNDEQISRRLPISGKSLFVNKRAILQRLWKEARAKNFYRRLFRLNSGAMCSNCAPKSAIRD